MEFSLFPYGYPTVDIFISSHFSKLPHLSPKVAKHYYWKPHRVQTVPNLWLFNLNFFILWLYESHMRFIEIIYQLLNFWSFLGLALCSELFSHNAGQWQQAAAPSNHTMTRANNPYTPTMLYSYNHSVVHFQYNIQEITQDSQHFIIK